MANTQNRGIMGAGWLNIVIGIAIAATPYIVGEFATVPFYSSLIVGIGVAALAIWNMLAARGGRSAQAIGTNGLELVGGLWLVVMPFIFATNMAYQFATVVEGVVLLITSGYVAYVLGRMRGTTRGSRRAS